MGLLKVRTMKVAYSAFLRQMSVASVSSRLNASYAHGVSNTPHVYDTIGDYLRRVVNEVPDKEYVVFRQQNIRKTFSQCYEDARKLAAALINLGCQKGDRVGIWGPNYYEWVTTQLATSMAGLIQVNVNPAYQTEELKFALDKVGVQVLITPTQYKKSNYYRTLQEVFPQIASHGVEGVGTLTHRATSKSQLKHVVIFGEDKPVKGAWRYEDFIESGGSNDYKTLDQIGHIITPDCPVNIQYTSGTTGSPKAATLTHFNILNNGRYVGMRANFHQTEQTICVPNPLYHCFGCVLGTANALVHKQKVVFPAPTFNSKDTLEAIHHEKCTFVYGTPTMFIDMLNQPDRPKYDLSSLKGGFISGAPCPRPLCERLVNEFNMRDLSIMYGSTELSPVVTMSYLDDDPFDRIKTVGYALDHTELVVVDENGEAVNRGEKGELMARGYMVMRGYYNDEDKTKAEVTPAHWYHTGDIAIMNERGEVSIVGRSKDMIVRGGENIYPTEIEQFIFKLPYIADAQVIGVPDERFGEEVCAWVRLRDEFKNDSSITPEKIKEDFKGKIAHYKIPKYILIKEEKEFPLTATGKVKKFELRELSKNLLGLNQVKSHFNE